MKPRRLYRSADDRILAGVAGGVAAYFDVDPVIVRIIWFLSIFFTGSLTFWAYLIMIIVVPLEPSEWPPQSPWAPGGGPAVGRIRPGYAPPTTGASPGAAEGAAPAPEAGVPTGSPAEAGQPGPGAAPTRPPECLRRPPRRMVEQRLALTVAPGTLAAACRTLAAACRTT